MNLEEKTIEEWQDIIGYECIYKISNLGNIESYDRVLKNHNGSYLFRSRKINSFISKLGYAKVHLSLNGKHKEFSVHRLIAKAFIPNLENKPEVNHIDGNKLNNSISNLEWCTRSENLQHAWDNNLRKVSDYNKKRMSNMVKSRSILDHKKAEIVLNLESGVYYYSIREASKAYNIERNKLASMLKNKRENKTNLKLA